METMEDKINTILSNPEMMQQIMSLAQSLGNNTTEQTAQSNDTEISVQPSATPFDLSMIQKLSGMAGQNSIDQEQRQLLQALSPYLSKDRVSKLENAMRAAKLAKLASSFLGNGGLQLLSGR